jgi:hypothetical protein
MQSRTFEVTRLKESRTRTTYGNDFRATTLAIAHARKFSIRESTKVARAEYSKSAPK